MPLTPPLYHYWETHLPFGGGGGSASCVGRVGGRYAMEALSQVRTVVLSGLTSPPGP